VLTEPLPLARRKEICDGGYVVVQLGEVPVIGMIVGEETVKIGDVLFIEIGDDGILNVEVYWGYVVVQFGEAVVVGMTVGEEMVKIGDVVFIEIGDDGVLNSEGCSVLAAVVEDEPGGGPSA
jgi:uridine phosphorylase